MDDLGQVCKGYSAAVSTPFAIGILARGEWLDAALFILNLIVLGLAHWYQSRQVDPDHPSPLAESAPVDLEMFRKLRSGPVPDGFADGVNTKTRKATRLNLRTLEEKDVTSLYFPKPDSEKTEAEIEADNAAFIESMKKPKGTA
jgi:hypothetical protein